MIEVLKLSYDDRVNQCLLLGVRWGLTQKDQQVAFWGYGSVLCLARGVSYTGEYLCQNQLKMYLRSKHFIVYKEKEQLLHNNHKISVPGNRR